MVKKRKNQEKPEHESASEILEEMTAEKTEDLVTEEALDPVTKIKNEMEAARAEASKNWDLYLRERADLENARKRHQREKEDALRYANDRLLKEMVPVLDNLERAVAHAEQAGDNNQGLLEGVNMTISQFRKALEDFGVKPINAIGADFDPNLHQAMGHIESAEQAPNTVVTEFQKGYLLHDRLLRPSLVMVAKSPTDPASGSDTQEPTNTQE
ncbi:MAG: nucleotide exchange factor GrpE [Desulfuromonadales bacterium]|nr:nucleotide exchange factor GrpE [Desulfuromonadales bacterium]